MAQSASPPGNSAQPFVRTEFVAPMRPPIGETGVIGWVRRNLFSSPLNSVLTLVALFLVWIVIPPMLRFAFFDAAWSGVSRLDCADPAQGGNRPEGWFGACWPYVGAYFKQFIYGRYPAVEHWRVNAVYAMFALGLVPLLIPRAPFKAANIAFLFGIFPIATFILLTGGNIRLDGILPTGALLAPSFAKFALDFALVAIGACALGWIFARGSESPAWPAVRNILLVFAALFGVIAVCAVDFGLQPVETAVWGGLLVTLVIAVTGIVASLPLGILLALGRRSQMPVVKLVSVIFIEFWRGVPLITVLFMSSVMLPLFLPDGVTFDKLLRALIGVALFSAAYMAETVRGGIQALGKGQYEGAMALGLSYWQMMRKIILPQALKIVIPSIVGAFIGLLKDTTLVSIIGIFDFLGQIQTSRSDATWATPVQSLTGYYFAAFVFWIFCFSMSRYSIYMERRLDTGHR
jgi:general L-amino acid transport system permease protein